ncbi:hypothetical protein OK016_04965 [Vibrio chagasii]|nr:hypothetical protein [Vibrio chagasii]
MLTNTARHCEDITTNGRRCIHDQGIAIVPSLIHFRSRLLSRRNTGASRSIYDGLPAMLVSGVLSHYLHRIHVAE